MSEVIKAEWFDIAKNKREKVWSWLHNEYLPQMQSLQGVSWVGHYEIEKHQNRPYIEAVSYTHLTLPTNREV